MGVPGIFSSNKSTVALWSDQPFEELYKIEHISTFGGSKSEKPKKNSNIYAAKYSLVATQLSQIPCILDLTISSALLVEW